MVTLLHLEDDDRAQMKMQLSLKKYSYDAEINYIGVSNEKEFFVALYSKKPDCLLLDISIGKEVLAGIEVLKKVRKEGFGGPIIMCSSIANPGTIALCVSHGATDFITKGLDTAELSFRIIHCINNKLSTKKQDNKSDFPEFVSGKTLREIYCKLPNVLTSEIKSVLVTGESGTGKEVVAKLFKVYLSNSIPFINVNCASFSSEVMGTELFGYVKGAFTGADKSKKGLFHAAHGGWIFLDELGRLSAGAQGALLRVLETGEIRRVGSSDIEMVNVKVIAATNENLEALVEKGLFRRDLLERLKCYEIHLPPLRERSNSEVEEILDFLVCRLNLSASSRGSSINYSLAEEAKKLLINASWKERNIRGLWQVLLSSSVEASNDGIITLDCFPRSFINTFIDEKKENEAGKLDQSASSNSLKINSEFKNRMFPYLNEKLEDSFREILKKIEILSKDKINYNETVSQFESFLIESSIFHHRKYNDAADALELSRSTFHGKKNKLNIN